MKLYRTDNKFVGTQDDAKRAAKQHGNGWQAVDVPVDKPGLIAYLNDLVVDAAVVGYNIGKVETEERLSEGPAPAPAFLAPAPGLSLDFDDAWEAMPLSRQAHFAALFCEEARTKLGNGPPPKAAQGYKGKAAVDIPLVVADDEDEGEEGE